jgi:hypothetical protein
VNRRCADSPLEETASCSDVAPWGDEHVNDLAWLVDGPVDIAPLAGDLHIGLVDLPALADGMSAGPGSLGQQAGEAKHPPVDGDVVDLDTAFGGQLLDVTVGQAKRRYQRMASTITSGGKQKPANAERAIGAVRQRRVLMATVCLLQLGHSSCNSASLGHREAGDRAAVTGAGAGSGWEQARSWRSCVMMQDQRSTTLDHSCMLPRLVLLAS